MVPPGEFIPLAEESSLILVLGEWVLREACREAASWDKPLRVAINVSPIQFRHGDLPRLVHSVLLESGLAPNRLELEITEGVLIDDFSRAVSILRRLKSLGVQIVLDDFGTGYSSLSYLRAFPFRQDQDRPLLHFRFGKQPPIRAIVRAVIGLSRNLNIPVMAEGVETQGPACIPGEGRLQWRARLSDWPAACDRGLCRCRRTHHCRDCAVAHGLTQGASAPFDRQPPCRPTSTPPSSDCTSRATCCVRRPGRAWQRSRAFLPASADERGGGSRSTG